MPTSAASTARLGPVWERFSEAVALQQRGPSGSPLQEEYTSSVAQPIVATATTFWGDVFRVVLPELVSCELHRYGLIEPALTKAVLELVRPGMVVYDVGAHVGYYAGLASHLGATVHAFEPARGTLPLLEHNVGRRATIIPRGLWDTERELDLRDYGAGHSAVNTFFDPKDESLSEPEAAYSVPVTTVDLYVRACGEPPEFMKIDAEGAEIEVLLGARETIAKFRPIITLEVGDSRGSARSRQAIELALSLGYQVFDMTLDGLARHTLRPSYSYDNVLLAPI